MKRFSVCHPFLILAFLVTGCDSGPLPDSQSQSSMSCDPFVENCLKPNSELLEMRVLSSNPLQLKAGVLRFDVGGECNDGNYRIAMVEWKLHNGQGYEILSSETTEARCKNLRFHLSIPLPAGFIFTQQYTLDMQLKARDDSRQPYIRNEIKGKKSINITFFD